MHWVRRVAGLESRAVGKGPLVLSQRDPRASWAWTFRTMDRDRGGLAGCPKGPGLAIYLGPTLLRSPGSHTRNDPRSCLE